MFDSLKLCTLALIPENSSTTNSEFVAIKFVLADAYDGLSLRRQVAFGF